MPCPRLLVIEGNTAELRARQVTAAGQIMSDGYADLLRNLLPIAVVDICYPADPGANLPIGGWTAMTVSRSPARRSTSMTAGRASRRRSNSRARC